MSALRVLSGICVVGAGVLAVAALISRPENPSGSERANGPAAQIEFRWSVPQESRPQPRPRLANNGSELQNEIAPARHTRKRHALAAEHHRSKHHHRHSEIAHISASTISEASAPAEPASRPRPDVAAVEDRLRNSLSRELYADFELFLYVSKAPSGPLAQHMYVFRKEGNGALQLLYDWPVSTGRDGMETNGDGLELSTSTPTGYFELDPHRFYRHHASAQWREPMPFAMFFHWVEHGRPTGVAIHAATKAEIAALGTRASAGCIRLSPEDARTLFTIIRTQYRGLTPLFAIDHQTGTISSNGIILHDAGGRPELTEGYKVLVVVENYGGANLVAAMY
ncbi:MAG TPA: L,D-transpeptidase [Rhizomicrobium sp.]|jgi:hypothetical protein|nr:L,D-transpeptidase [Rhizomicrobium sp.]